MATYDEILGLAKQTSTQITASAESWEKFLHTAAYNYQYAFTNQPLIFARRPDAAMVAPMVYWNKEAGRWIEKGAKGIAFINADANRASLRYVHGRADRRHGIVFATGTPISNSMTELYVMLRCLQHSMLEQNGLGHFDSWASTFGESVTAIELSPESTGYRTKTRFAKFYNLPERMSLFKMAADIQTADMLKLPVPELATGKPINAVLKPSDIQKDMVAALGERADKVRSGDVDPRSIIG